LRIKLLAEFVGTFTLVFIGAGAAATGGSLTDVALAHGFVIIGAVCAFGGISGAHVNPAVTLAALLARAVEAAEGARYWLAQFLGAVAAAALLAWLLGQESGLGATRLAPDIDPIRGIAVEAVITFFLASAVLYCAVAGRGGGMEGVAIGTTLAFGILMGGTLTGGSMNPARSFGPALMMGQLDQMWIYVAGPFLGAAIAALIYNKWLGGSDE
jgi:MIP family channel proteins